MVRCPDMYQIQQDIKKRNKKLNKCCYSIVQHECEAWQDYNKKKQLLISKRWDNSEYTKNLCSQCTLTKTALCPKHIERTELGKQQKVFRIDNTTYRKLSSGAAYMTKASKHKTIFFTLTFPQFKKETNETELNACFSKFMENLHNTYKCKYYIAVREYGEVTCRPHYHVLCTIKFIDFRKLNAAWNSAISDICEFSKTAFRTTRESVVLYNPGKALRYCCKYFSKAKHTRSFTRVVFMSMPLILKPIAKYGINSLELIRATLTRYKSIYVSQQEYATIFRITDATEFDDFCNIYLYSLFGIDQGKTNFTGLPGIEGLN